MLKQQKDGLDERVQEVIFHHFTLLHFVYFVHTFPTSCFLSFSRCTSHFPEMLQRPVSRNRLLSAFPLVAVSKKPPRKNVVRKFAQKKTPKTKQQNEHQNKKKNCFTDGLYYFSLLTLGVSWQLSVFSAGSPGRTKWIFALGRPSPRLSQLPLFVSVGARIQSFSKSLTTGAGNAAFSELGWQLTKAR